jgi:8-amino-3,8-dideoxy-alpha-D-manno-octulosonate transaminase
MFPGGMMIGAEEEQAVLETLRSKRLFRFAGPTAGPSQVEELEQEFAAMVGVPYALAVNSGTAALLCGLESLGVGPGDEVIIPAFTWISCPAAVMTAGAIPVLAEIDASLTIDPADVERKISPYTKAIMPVHMRGVACRMDELLAVARRHHLEVIEDGAQAVGGTYHGRRLGSLGDVGCFSLQFHKIVTGGEGGMVVTSDRSLWQRAVMFHEVSATSRYDISEDQSMLGLNLRMAELVGAVARVQLRRLDGLIAAMRQRKRAILDGISDICRRKGVGMQDVPDPDGDASVAAYMLMPSQTLALKVAEALQAENIGATIWYRPDEVNMHAYPCWTAMMQKRTWSTSGGPWRWAQRAISYTVDMCPRSLDLLGRAIHLDVNPLYTEQDVAEIVAGIVKVLNALA